MLELKKSPGKTVENFLGKVEKSLGEEAQVWARKQELVIECKDIDEITTKEDIRDALEKQFGPFGLQDSAIRGLRKAYGGTQTATISFPTEAAFKLLAAGKVKIGWAVCRLREQVSLKRCFRCLDCPALARVRLRTLGKPFFGDLSEISSYRVGELLSFVNATGWL